MLSIKQKSALFDEKQADREVVKSLKRQIRKLEGNYMSKIIKSVDGKFYRIHDHEEISLEEAKSELAHAQNEVAELESFLSEGDAPQPAEPTPTDTPVDSPAPQPAAEPPVVDPAPAPEAAPEVPPTPAPAETPAVDAAPEAPADGGVVLQ